MIEDAVVPPAEPKWLRIRNEMDLMSPRRELNAQFCGYHARTAIRGVTRDANAHKSFSFSDFYSTITWTLCVALKMHLYLTHL
jgi:hypothetical protein